MRKCLLAAVVVFVILLPAKGQAAFDEAEMEAWSIHINVCGVMFQYLASAGVEEVAITMKEDLLRLARNNGGSQMQLLELDKEFEEGRLSAIYRGYETGNYPREIDLNEYAEFGKRIHKSCKEWSYAGPV